MVKTRMIIPILLVCGVMLANDARADEEALFVTKTDPDALILLDLSGSMAWNPAGDDPIYGSTASCVADTTSCTGTGCFGGFCTNSKSAVTYYAAAACNTPDTTNCVGSNCSNGFCSTSKGATTVYAASSCNTPDYANCRGTTCGRTDGFCNNAAASGITYYAHSSCSTPDTYNCGYDREARPDCRNGFCASPRSSYSRSCTTACTTTGCAAPCTTAACATQCVSGGCTENCSRIAIAKRSIFNILDDNNDNVINSTDRTSLGVRLGYMRFYNCGADDTGNSYNDGCNKLLVPIDDSSTSYSTIYANVNTASASGGTPLISALKEAKLYLDDNKAGDGWANCRQKFVILITDGSDTYGCGGDGSECDPGRYKNRREVVAKAKALRDAGYRVFVIGFGSAMPPYLRNTLNWMAFYGGTDNPNAANSGSTTDYSIVTGCNATDNPSACCNADNPTACYPTGVTGCGAAGSTMTAACYDSTNPYPGTAGNSTANFRASTNDPGYLDLSGYAFLAGDADQLVAAVKAAISIIREATYSFSQSSIQSSRTADENFIYEGSFQPITGDPFWHGHLRRYTISTENGQVGAAADWDAGLVLKEGTTAASRTIKTYKGGSLQDFTTDNITPADLGITDPALTDAQKNAQRDAVVGYIRGESASNPDNWKLGDVFRSTPITVGTPSPYFDDIRDASEPTAFSQHREAHQRSTSGSGRLIIAGANDGQLHAFRTSDGHEAWSFIPPNMLPRLKLITHASEPSSLTHQYYVDGPVTVADAWIPGSWSNGKSKSMSDWHTLMISGEGRGAGTNLWSSSASCDSGFNPAYVSPFTNYCGYYALDLNNSESPVFKWRFGGFSASQAAYMGAPWSKVMVGRVVDGGNEKWVGFVGGGAYAPGAAESGKGFFIVDLATGNILWSYTKANNASLDFPMPAPPAIVDSDNDGFIDTVYLGDIGGHMWRFKLCLKADGDSCGTSNWTGGRLFDSGCATASSCTNPKPNPVYTSAAVSSDRGGNLWVFWGTGDKLDPVNKDTTNDNIFAVKDDRTTMRVKGSLQQIASGGTLTDTSKAGYYISMNTGEKVLADVAVFGGVLYATTFTPVGSSTDKCDQG